MIFRIWKYRLPAVDATRFEQFEHENGLPMVRQAGCLQVDFMRRRPEPGDEPGMIEYVMVSAWENWQQLETALNSKLWQDEVALFLSQGFGEGNGEIGHYDSVSGGGEELG